MKKQYKCLLFFLVPGFLFVVVSCTQLSIKFLSPPGYDFNQPEKFLMPDDLLEISGIAFNKYNPDTIFSIQDEEGRLYVQTWGIKKPFISKFGAKGDYEDLTIIKETVFILKSNGSFYAFPLKEHQNKKAGQVKEWKKILPKGEYESLYGVDSASRLYVLCKECAVDQKKDQTTGYQLEYDAESGELIPSGTFSIDTKGLQSKKGKKAKGLRASAITQNPVTGEWFILSAINKSLIVADDHWRIKSTYRLDSGVFNQPEGIAFDKDQNLYISNEGDEITNGNILKFKYVAKNNKP